MSGGCLNQIMSEIVVLKLIMDIMYIIPLKNIRMKVMGVMHRVQTTPVTNSKRWFIVASQYSNKKSLFFIKM